MLICVLVAAFIWRMDLSFCVGRNGVRKLSCWELTGVPEDSALSLILVDADDAL
ncbi:hypothetical protein KP509_1Z112700 [Ceratopteris richardii]|nr:hypothetical protein KP509_1Z112700 [Ceratopteris richardii]